MQEIKRQALLNSNTNLERISDWLTTMLVGATLVQLYKINDLLVAFRDFLAKYATVFSNGHGGRHGRNSHSHRPWWSWCWARCWASCSCTSTRGSS